jgi:hypothetical protein
MSFADVVTTNMEAITSIEWMWNRIFHVHDYVLNIVRVTEELDYSIDKSFQNGLGLLSLLPDVSHCWRRAQPPSWGIRRVVGI